MFKNFLKKIDEYEDNNDLAETLYFESLKRIRDVQNDVSKLEKEKHVEKVLKPFLSNWGLMSRVVGRTDVNWKGLTEALRKSEPQFKLLRDKKLISINFSEDIETVNTIKTICKRMARFKHIGPTTRSKILHLINPEVFVMLDDDILKHYHKLNRKINGSPDGYIEFLDMSKTKILETLTKIGAENQKTTDIIIGDLCNKHRYCYDNSMTKSLAKFIDAYNWNTVPRKKSK